jgi:nucleotide-binding universal stress UspA family protein
MIAIKNVLVATDFSPGSETALAYGREMARTFGARLHVLHVVEDVTKQFYMAENMLGDPPPVELQRQLESVATERLEACVADDDRRELRAVTAVRTSLGAARGIVDYATSSAIDVIVIGTHGRGGMAHMLIGSVAERVVRTAPCPVLTVRHDQRDFLRPDALQRMEAAE